MLDFGLGTIGEGGTKKARVVFHVVLNEYAMSRVKQLLH